MRESFWLVEESVTDKRIHSGEMSRGMRGRGKGGFVPRSRASCGNPPPNVSTTNSASRGKFGTYSQPTPQESSSSRSFDNIFANIKPPNLARAQLFVEAQKRDASENCDKLDDEDDNRCNFCGSASHRSRFCTVLTEQSNPTAHITCNYCKRKGHYKADCPKQPGNLISKKTKKWEGASNNSSSASNSAENVAGKGASKEGSFAVPQWAKVNVPMPVPSSSLKAVVQLRSQSSFNDGDEKVNDTSATITLGEMQCKSTYRSGRRIADSCAAKAPPKFTYCRSDSDEYATDSDSDLSSLGGEAAARSKKKNTVNDPMGGDVDREAMKTTVEPTKDENGNGGEGVLATGGGVPTNGNEAANNKSESKNDEAPKSVDNKHLEALGRMLKESLCLTKTPSFSEKHKASHPSTIQQSKDEPNESKRMNGLMRTFSGVSNSSDEGDNKEEGVADEEPTDEAERCLAPKICVDFDSGSDFDEIEKGDDDDDSDEVYGVILPLDARF